MLTVGSPTLGQHAAFERRDNFLNLSIRKENCFMALDVGSKPVCNHVGRHGCFERAVAPEHYDGEKLVVPNAQKDRKRLCVPIVLVERVLKSELLTEQALCPLRAFIVPKDPSIDVLCFDHENPISGNNHMVDLGRAIGCRDSDVIEVKVGIGIQEYLLGESALHFSKPAFDQRP